jgi:hypothetical protein
MFANYFLHACIMTWGDKNKGGMWHKSLGDHCAMEKIG